MSHLKLERKSQRKALSIIIVTLASLLIPSNLYAETISPIFTEVTQTIGETSNQSVNIGNTKDYDIYLTPHLYKYNPDSEQILDLESFENFIKIDTTPLLIPAHSTKTVPFQVLGIKALEPGTYYTLITFAPQLDAQTHTDSATGVTAQNSHIIILNLTKDINLETITEDYKIYAEVTNRGIPFLKPAQLRITFFNNSKYTLIPKGEIQVVKNSADEEPEYIKINLDREKVYPENSLEMNFKVNNWYIEDILLGKTAYIKIQNGIDNGVITQEMKIPGFRNESLYMTIALIAVLTLTKSVKRKTKPNLKPSE